jgi:CPA2 family monovalent cation:H+ antiporter-2
MISIALNPLLFKAIEPLQRWLLATLALARKLERATTRWPSCR